MHSARAGVSGPADQTRLLVEPQRRSRQTRALRHFIEVQIAHALDLKST
jgi:hypothetical protein